MLREALRPRAPDARGLHLEEILAEWPELEREDIQQARLCGVGHGGAGRAPRHGRGEVKSLLNVNTPAPGASSTSCPLFRLTHQREQLVDALGIRRARRPRPLEMEPRATEVARLEPGEGGVAERGLGLARGPRALLR